MSKLTLKNGTKVEFEPLVYNEKNLSKTRLCNNDEDGEGIWIVVSDKDKADLDNDVEDGYFVAMLANTALNFDFDSWGMHIVCKHQGTDRPLSDITWIDYNELENRIFSTDCQNN